MSERFEHVFKASWGQMDFNGHMANTAYLDLAADVRLMFFSLHGFPMKEFARLRFGPCMRSDHVEYFREIGLLEDVRVDVAMAALSPDGARFRIRNDFYRADGVRAARVTSEGGWLDLSARKLTVPPESLRLALEATARTDDFVEL